MTIKEHEFVETFRQLDSGQQKQVLHFMRDLTQPQGIPLKDLMARAREVNFDPADLAEMAQAIEACCG